jgi:hypothetical protein
LVDQRKFLLSSWSHLCWQMLDLNRQTLCFFIYFLSTSLNMRFMKSLAPKLYLDLQPYSQNTIHKHFSRVFTVASIAILIPLHRKRSKSYSAYLGKKMTRYTQDNTFQIHRVTVYFTLRMEDKIRLRF